MIKTCVVNLRYISYDVRITRPGPFGNPFVIGRDGDRATVIAKFEAWVRAQPELVARIKRELRGRRLGCVCAPASCHGDVLARIADE